uniref:Integral membrane protein n=1 Tax=Streptomyces sp. NBC_00003 TaxID=2903608 RepID=A0AAU2V619_9ACTN
MSTPHAPAGAGLRLLRAAVFAAVCVVLSAMGHVMAACATVPWWTLLAGFLGVFAVVAPLAGRERTLPSIAGVLAAGQLGLHTLFGIGQHTAAASGSGSTGDLPVIQFAAKLICGSGAAPLTAADAQRIVTDAGIDPSRVSGTGHASMSGMSQMGDMMSGMAGSGPGSASLAASLLPTLPMLLCHLLAALATGWLLRRGEVALFRVVRLAAESVTAAAEATTVRSLRRALSFAAALCAGLLAAAGPSVPLADRRETPPLPGAALQHSVIRRGPPAAYALAA